MSTKISMQDVLFNPELTKELTSVQKDNIKLVLDGTVLQEIKAAPITRLRELETTNISILTKAKDLLLKLGDHTCANALDYHIDKTLTTKNELIKYRLDEMEEILKENGMSVRDWNKTKKILKLYLQQA